MSEDTFLKQFINKRVDIRFHGTSLQFYLSHSLFSSHDIDDGTKLLLKSIAQEIALDRTRTLLDIGCGVGVLGLCLKKYQPQIEATFQDRDGLALAFTQLNAQLNQITQIETQSALALKHDDPGKFDLIVSNLPGKAGSPVLQDIVGRIPAWLSDTGQAAVVIVKPLESLVAETLRQSGCEVTLQTGNKGYTVFHFRPAAGEEIGSGSLDPYVRGTYEFEAAKTAFTLRTVYSVPEFDTLGYHTLLAMNVIKSTPIQGKVLFWNPGQGHLPLFVQKISGENISEYVLGGRDLLSLCISEQNLLEEGVPQAQIQLAHQPHLLRLAGEFDFICLFPAVEPGVPWDEVLLGKCYQLLKSGGKFLLIAKSSFMFRLLAPKTRFRMKSNKRRHGFRAVLFEK